MQTPANHDINVIPAWLAGYSGKGVTISIIDDGLDHKHPELIDRYVSMKISFLVGGGDSFSDHLINWEGKQYRIYLHGIFIFFSAHSNLSSVMI
jgi:subtilisin family serine protease